jgi:rhamnulokinase
LLEDLGIPTHILPEVVPPGTRLGNYEGMPVIAPACHDTGSAVAAVPAQTADFAYISSGTWCLVGLEVERPLITAAALAANVTNEGGVDHTYRLLKNVMGLWILQQCRAQWERDGTPHTYDELVQLAGAAPPWQHVINPNDPLFLTPGDHPQHIRDYCRRTGQATPASKGAIVRCVLESLALAYRAVLAELTAVSGRNVAVIHLVGGGSQNELLNQMTAGATGLPVVAGPSEATVIGNALVQFVALGEIENIAQGRQVVANSAPLRRYEAQDQAYWPAAYEQYKEVTLNENGAGGR